MYVINKRPFVDMESHLDSYCRKHDQGPKCSQFLNFKKSLPGNEDRPCIQMWYYQIRPNIVNILMLIETGF